MSTLQLSEAGAAFIARFEGFSATPYRCPADHPTIGFGHRILPHETFAGPLSREAALTLLQQDATREAEPVARALTVSLTVWEQDALISLAFNCGGGAIRKSTLLKRLNAGLFQEAAEQFLRWDKAGGKTSKGLTRRRKAERELFLNGVYGGD